MKDNREYKGVNDKRYFAVKHRPIKRNLMITISLCIVLIGIGIGIINTGGLFAQSNNLLIHNHIQLDITLNGKPIEVPSHIGMKQAGADVSLLLYGNHTLDQYGMNGMSPLHTHDDSGIIHVESIAIRNFTLGKFLSVWRGLVTNGKFVKAYLNDKIVSHFPNIILNDGEKIKLDILS